MDFLTALLKSPSIPNNLELVVQQDQGSSDQHDPRMNS